MTGLGGQVGRCRSCGKPIIWARTEAGKAMPVDALPVATGNLVATGEDTVRYVSKGRPAEPGVPLYVSHFSTCPDSKGWRKQ